jgi:carboxylesterase type B
MEFGFIQHSLPKPDLSISELDGLNLNITVPLVKKELPAPDRKLPVFVFIHGGAYSIGSNAWPQYSQARIIKLSVDIGVPVIGVGIK